MKTLAEIDAEIRRRKLEGAFTLEAEQKVAELMEERARLLRSRPTSFARRLWEALRRRGR